ncbi:MAG TPA: response regulator [Dehalococcoidia bacterium]
MVEDDPSVSRLVALVLRSEGFEVSTARDGLDGIHVVSREPPDLIVLDLSMPNIDGRTFVALMRRMGLHCHVLILSAYGAAEAAQELKVEGAIEKPFDPEDLVREAERILASAEPGTDSASAAS